MADWTLVEPCCGTAALSLFLLGATRQIVPRQGSKWRLRRALASLVERCGFEGPPSRVVLSDAAPWPIVLEMVLVHRHRRLLLRRLRDLVAEGADDPRALHDRLHGAQVPIFSHARLAAELLWLQRMSYAGRAVEVVGGRWHSHGLNLTSAYGVEGTEKFGAVRPLGPALIEAVESAPIACSAFHRRTPTTRAVLEVGTGLARPSGLVERTVVYLDPDYVGTTGYGCSLPRAAVVELATEWSAAGAWVIVSEAQAVVELVARGWHAQPLDAAPPRSAVQLFRRKHRSEWVTWAGPPQLELPWSLRGVADERKRQQQRT